MMVSHVGVGNNPPPKKDMHRFVKWPKYVRVQRQRRVLNQRLKVPPALNRFTKTLDKNAAFTVFKLLLKYRPEDKFAKKVSLSQDPLELLYSCQAVDPLFASWVSHLMIVDQQLV